jgi:sugar phosphate isomerase/epimerase
MKRTYSLAYLTSCQVTPPVAMQVAADLGYQQVGFRLLPNMPGGPQQFMIDRPEVLRETLAVQRATGVQVCDLELIRIGAEFDARAYLPLFEVGAALKAKHVLVAGDDTDEDRLANSYATLCELMRPFNLTADLEFMPWTALKDVKTTRRVIEAAGNPSNAGILVDALHFGRSTTTLEDIRTIPRDWLHYAQICDAQAGLNFTTEQMIHTARCERLLVGEGNIDVKGLFAALPQDLPVSVEVVHLERMAKQSPAEWARLCLENAVATLEPQFGAAK